MFRSCIVESVDSVKWCDGDCSKVKHVFVSQVYMQYQQVLCVHVCLHLLTYVHTQNVSDNVSEHTHTTKNIVSCSYW